MPFDSMRSPTEASGALLPLRGTLLWVPYVPAGLPPLPSYRDYVAEGASLMHRSPSSLAERYVRTSILRDGVDGWARSEDVRLDPSTSAMVEAPIHRASFAVAIWSMSEEKVSSFLRSREHSILLRLAPTTGPEDMGSYTRATRRTTATANILRGAARRGGVLADYVRDSLPLSDPGLLPLFDSYLARESAPYGEIDVAEARGAIAGHRRGMGPTSWNIVLADDRIPYSLASNKLLVPDPSIGSEGIRVEQLASMEFWLGAMQHFTSPVDLLSEVLASVEKRSWSHELCRRALASFVSLYSPRNPGEMLGWAPFLDERIYGRRVAASVASGMLSGWPYFDDAIGIPLSHQIALRPDLLNSPYDVEMRLSNGPLRAHLRATREGRTLRL